MTHLYSKNKKLIHHNDPLEALITMHVYKIQNFYFKLVKAGVNSEGGGQKTSDLLRVPKMRFKTNF